MSIVRRIITLEGRGDAPRPSGPPPDLARLTPAERLEADAILAGIRPGGDLTGLTDDDLHRLKTLWITAWAR